MAKIILKGKNDGAEVEFNPSRHVELTGGFYEKNDTENVAVINSRYYRKNSPLIAQLSERIYGPNRFCMASECVTDDSSGEAIHVSETISTGEKSHSIFNKETSDLTILPRGSRVYYSQSWSTLRNCDDTGRTFDINVLSSSIVDARSSGDIVNKGGRFLLAKHTFQLHPSYGLNHIATFLGTALPNGSYAKSVEDILNIGILLEIDGGLHWGRDIRFSYTPSGEEYRPISNHSTGYRFDKRQNPFSVSSNALRQDIREAMLAAIRSSSRTGINNILKSNWFGESRIDSDFETKNYLTKFGLQCGSKEDSKLIDMMYDLCLKMGPQEKLGKFSIDHNWMGAHSYEPIPVMYTANNIGNQGGDYVYHNAQRLSIIDKNNSHTGGIGYTFGVEIETEKGILPLELARNINISAVGDRSIGALEYVTGVMSGNSGMDHLMGVVETISQYCLVANTCGIHVHVGSDGGKWSPIFDKEFSVLAIKVGCAIEKELFSLLPDNRMDGKNSNGQPYCGSILSYSDINMKNWKERLFHYVFGRNTEDPSEGFSEITSLVEKRHQVNRWGAGRYKWLNLINCTTDNSGRRNGGGFQTIEFRAFNGTLNKDDIMAFVLISLSFVEFIERYRKEIMEISNISIMGIAGSTMSGEGLSFFTDWYDKRLQRVDLARKDKMKTETAKPI